MDKLNSLSLSYSLADKISLFLDELTLETPSRHSAASSLMSKFFLSHLAGDHWLFLLTPGVWGNQKEHRPAHSKYFTKAGASLRWLPLAQARGGDCTFSSQPAWLMGRTGWRHDRISGWGIRCSINDANLERGPLATIFRSWCCCIT